MFQTRYVTLNYPIASLKKRLKQTGESNFYATFYFTQYIQNHFRMERTTTKKIEILNFFF